MALQQSDRAKKNDNLTKAYRAIIATAQLYPDMGGDQWYANYDALLKNIERQQNKEMKGLKAILNPSTRSAQR